MLVNELKQFPATKARILTHDAINSNMKVGFKDWLVGEGNKVRETDDQFQKWDATIKESEKSGKDAEDKPVLPDSFTGLKHTKHVTEGKDSVLKKPKII